MKNTAIKEDHLYRKAYAKGKSAAGKYVVAYLLKDTANYRIRKADPLHRPVNRLGITVGKKLGGAVERNRAKRLLRESYRLIEKEEAGRLRHGFLLVLAARGRINGANGNDVRADVTAQLRRLGLLTESAAADGSEQ